MYIYLIGVMLTIWNTIKKRFRLMLFLAFVTFLLIARTEINIIQKQEQCQDQVQEQNQSQTQSTIIINGSIYKDLQFTVTTIDLKKDCNRFLGIDFGCSIKQPELDVEWVEDNFKFGVCPVILDNKMHLFHWKRKDRSN